MVEGKNFQSLSSDFHMPQDVAYAFGGMGQ